MTDIIEAAREYGRQLSVIDVAAQTLKDAADLSAFWDDEVETRRVAQAVLAAVTPLIRTQALEEAAVVAEGQPTHYPDADFSSTPHRFVKDQIAAAIRALKEQP
jgi:hypothetical protein